MIIHCLSCGKCISSNKPSCPYCLAHITDLTLEMNAVDYHRPTFSTKMKQAVVGLVHK